MTTTATPHHPRTGLGAHPAGRARRHARADVRPLPTGRRALAPPAASSVPAGVGRDQLAPVVDLPRAARPPFDDQDGSLVAEYGLLAVVAATVAGVLITWASNGALAGFFDALLSSARGLVGA